MIKYIEDNFHMGNMMYDNGHVVLIDFGRFDYGDPWEEFHCLNWIADEGEMFKYVRYYYDSMEGMTRIIPKWYK